MKSATMGQASVQIHATPEKVYDLVSDVTRMGDWSPETNRCKWIGDAAGPKTGARFKAHNRRGVMRWSNKPTVLSADRGHDFSFERRAPGVGTVQWHYRMTAAGNGTELTESYEVTKPGLSMMNWMMGAMIRVKDRDADLANGLRQTLAAIKSAAEAN
jgi:hypothetical protein